jgi:cell division protein FtsB
LTWQLRVATLAGMPRRIPHRPTDEPARAIADPDGAAAGPDAPPERPTEPGLRALPVAGITRRRLSMVLGGVLAMWIVVVFARQVSEAAAATSRAEAMVASNTAKKAEIDSLEQELERIQDPRYIAQQARGYELGGDHEIPFTLAAGASPLPEDAPGSAVRRVGATPSVSPLERWLTILFGPGG